jgi:hypothetical protein
MLLPGKPQHITKRSYFLLQSHIFFYQGPLLSREVPYPCDLFLPENPSKALFLVLLDQFLMLLMKEKKGMAEIFEVGMENLIILVEVVHEVTDEEEVVGLEWR